MQGDRQNFAHESPLQSSETMTALRGLTSSRRRSVVYAILRARLVNRTNHLLFGCARAFKRAMLMEVGRLSLPGFAACFGFTPSVVGRDTVGFCADCSGALALTRFDGRCSSRSGIGAGSETSFSLSLLPAA